MQGTVFALAFVAMQVGRTVFTCLVDPPGRPGWRMNLLRITCWLSFSGVFWIAGGWRSRRGLPVDHRGGDRILLGPAVRFRSPVYGASQVADWEVEGGHMAERCALFIIIALGESIVVTGATFAELTWTVHTVVAFVVALIVSMAMWWIYFHIGRGSGRRANFPIPAKPGGWHGSPIPTSTCRSSRASWSRRSATNCCWRIPDGHADIKAILSMIGGPLLFLIGTILFKRSIRGIFQLSHLAGIALLVIADPFARVVSPLLLSAATTVMMLIVAAWEAISLAAISVSDEISGRHQRMNREHAVGIGP